MAGLPTISKNDLGWHYACCWCPFLAVRMMEYAEATQIRALHKALRHRPSGGGR